MGNEKNLRPFGTLTESEQREIRSKGGKASGKKRRERKLMAELLREALSQEVKTRAGETITHEIGVIRGLILKAEAGDPRAIALILKILGQMPKEQISVDMNEPRKFVFELVKNKKNCDVEWKKILRYFGLWKKL